MRVAYMLKLELGNGDTETTEWLEEYPMDLMKEKFEQHKDDEDLIFSVFNINGVSSHGYYECDTWINEDGELTPEYRWIAHDLKMELKKG